jgi:hypothetical protein
LPPVISNSHVFPSISQPTGITRRTSRTRFQPISHNPLLVPDGIKIHPDSISIDDLRRRAWEIFEPVYHARLASLADDFAVAKSKNLGLDDLERIGEAAVAGHIAAMIEGKPIVPGRIQAYSCE